METRKAEVVNEGSLFYLELEVTKGSIRIPLNEDKPNDIKEVFNKLIIELKSTEFNYELLEIKENLYCQVSDEYLKQLNRELSTIYLELSELELLA